MELFESRAEDWCNKNIRCTPNDENCKYTLSYYKHTFVIFRLFNGDYFMFVNGPNRVGKRYSSLLNILDTMIYISPDSKIKEFYSSILKEEYLRNKIC